MINVFIECYKIHFMQNNSNKKCKTLILAYVIYKDAFLPKGLSNEVIWGVWIVNFNTILFVFILLCQDCVCMQYNPTAAFTSDR